jgi:hypothetical protein
MIMAMLPTDKEYGQSPQGQYRRAVEVSLRPPEFGPEQLRIACPYQKRPRLADSLKMGREH